MELRGPVQPPLIIPTAAGLRLGRGLAHLVLPVQEQSPQQSSINEPKPPLPFSPREKSDKLPSVTMALGWRIVDRGVKSRAACSVGAAARGARARTRPV